MPDLFVAVQKEFDRMVLGPPTIRLTTLATATTTTAATRTAIRSRFTVIRIISITRLLIDNRSWDTMVLL